MGETLASGDNVELVVLLELFDVDGVIGQLSCDLVAATAAAAAAPGPTF